MWFPSLFININDSNHLQIQVFIIRIQTSSAGFIYNIRATLAHLGGPVIWHHPPFRGFLRRQPVNQSRVCEIKTICGGCHPSASFVCHLRAEWAWMRVNYGWQETASSDADADAFAWLMRLPRSLKKKRIIYLHNHNFPKTRAYKKKFIEMLGIIREINK